VIDLDILFYDHLHLASPDLTLPHPRLAERSFVLQPLCDLEPALRHAVLGQSVHALWQGLGAASLPKVMPIGGQVWAWADKTYIMGILNLTPDTPGWCCHTAKPWRGAQANRRGRRRLWTSIVDAAGTRAISVAEEPGRGPVIGALAQKSQPISVDTFRAEVAKAALGGAAMLNDVWDCFDLRLTWPPKRMCRW
jgi:hypothetical protein